MSGERSPIVGAVVAGLAFVIAGVVPALVLLDAGYSDDPTATGDAGTLTATLVVVALAVGALLAAVGWLVARSQGERARAALSLALVATATVAGVLMGFLGGVAIAFARHPTWDDA